jgi:hypothetical protein
MDFATIVYLVILASLGVNTVLMGWWSYYYPKVSTIFACIGTLFGALWLTYFTSFLSRVYGAAWYVTIREEWWWQAKNIPVAAVSVTIMIIFIERLLKSMDDDDSD